MKKVVVVHPGTQHGARLACQLDRVGLLHRYITGLAFSNNSPFLKRLPAKLKYKILNRVLDCDIET
ncbi:MAG TPA: hypothetical protein VGQ59_11560, partial [Cyclobacteriaceae bacterium]|nr:hypothetical protein [Cyclobacteriaceae bacterium]